jgi:hypothetical protein
VEDCFVVKNSLGRYSIEKNNKFLTMFNLGGKNGKEKSSEKSAKESKKSAKKKVSKKRMGTCGSC